MNNTIYIFFQKYSSRGNHRYERTYTYSKLCVECVMSQITKVTRDDVVLMTSQWNISGMFRMSKMSNMLHDVYMTSKVNEHCTFHTQLLYSGPCYQGD